MDVNNLLWEQLFPKTVSQKKEVTMSSTRTVETSTQKEISRDSFLEAQAAMLEARSLVAIGQENYTDPKSENIYNLLGVIGEKVSIALDFFNENELCWKTAEAHTVTQ
jgi:hypothetical protein